MSRCAFIKIPSAGPPQLYVPGSDDKPPVWLEDAGEAPAALRRQVQAQTLVALVPTQDCLFRRVAIPVRNAKQLEAALPFALEDELSADLEEVHIANARRDDGDVDAVVVSHARMGQWLEALEATGFTADVMIPEALALPIADNVWQVSVDGDMATVRCGNSASFAVEIANLPLFLDMELRDAGAQERPRLALHGQESETVRRLAQVLSAHDWDLEPVDVPAFPLLAIQPGVPAFDLLQGRYRPDQHSPGNTRAWTLGLACALLLGVAEMSYLAWDNQRLSKESDALAAEITQVYRSANPGATRVVNPKAQMRQLLNTRVDDNGRDFLGLMRSVSEAFAEVAEGEVSRLSFNQGKLDMDVTVAAVNTVEMLKNKLAERNAVLSVLSLDSGDQGIAAHLRAEAASR